mmetsp:Transcript_21577/g.24087  ORF Transcript_21577/g.24087 Transcript_21577/m.24087 type:complete len:99 (-) Transcript_21577:61-357(-)
MAASEIPLPGASFNSPGVYSWFPQFNLCGESKKYAGVKYEVHLTDGDVVSMFAGCRFPSNGHIAEPKWAKAVAIPNGPKEAERKHAVKGCIARIGALE